MNRYIGYTRDGHMFAVNADTWSADRHQLWFTNNGSAIAVAMFNIDALVAWAKDGTIEHD